MDEPAPLISTRATDGDAAAEVQRIVQRLDARLAELPVLPSMLVQLAALDPEQPDYFDRVLALVNADPGFAVRLLRLANAAGQQSTQTSRAIESTTAALIKVGARAAVELMLTAHAARIFPARLDWQRDLWMHSILAAHFMRRLAPFVRDYPLDMNEAYLAGLLHDIGRFLLFLEAPEPFREVGEGDWDTPQALLEAEHGCCGYTHADLGALALGKWGVGETLALVARDHHRDSGAHSGQQRALLELLRDVDWLALRVARDGTAWFEQPLEAIDAQLSAHMVSHYRGDLTHRLNVLRQAAGEALRLAAALGVGWELSAGAPSAPA